MATPNTIERNRIEIGLTGPQMLRALNAKRFRTSLLKLPDEKIDSALMQRANDLVMAYRGWTSLLRRQVTYEASTHGTVIDGEPCLTAVQVGRILGISDFKVAKHATRGQIGSIVQGRNRLYPLTAIIEFIDRNSAHLSPTSKHSRAPLATSFLDWYVRQTAASPVLATA